MPDEFKNSKQMCGSYHAHIVRFIESRQGLPTHPTFSLPGRAFQLSRLLEQTFLEHNFFLFILCVKGIGDPMYWYHCSNTCVIEVDSGRNNIH